MVRAVPAGNADADADAETTPQVDFALVNQGEDQTRILSYLTTSALDGANIYLDPGRTLMQKFGVLGLPATYFLDASGQVQGVHIGEMSETELRDAMAEHFAIDTAFDG